MVIKEAEGEVPLGIFRPAIGKYWIFNQSHAKLCFSVISTYKEPQPAWINNLYGPTGVFIAAGLGLLRILHCDRAVNANLVPVDMCVNSLIVAAKEVSDNFLQGKKMVTFLIVNVEIYISCSTRSRWTISTSYLQLWIH